MLVLVSFSVIVSVNEYHHMFISVTKFGCEPQGKGKSV